jgi:hypothetical protein
MFFSYFAERQIFDLEKYYKESTDDDLREFAKNPKIKITDLGNFIGVSDKWIRRKVAFVMQSGILEKIDLEAAKKTALLFDIDLVIESVNGVSTILLPIEKSKLKDVLKFLDEDYFQSILLSNPRISSSKRRIGY